MRTDQWLRYEPRDCRDRPSFFDIAGSVLELAQPTQYESVLALLRKTRIGGSLTAGMYGGDEFQHAE